MGSVVSPNHDDKKPNKSSELKTIFPTDSNLETKSKDSLLGSCQKTQITRVTLSQNAYIRAVSKNGECKIYPYNVPKKHFIRDIFTTLVDLKWRYTLTIFVLSFFVSWVSFALLWWLIALGHGDLEENHLPMNQATSNWTPCVTDIYDFTSCFLFSVETQQTTGYGEKRPTEKCSDAVMLMCLQSIIGLIVDAFTVGIIFAKLIRPKNRAQTIKFSKHAVISMNENTLCLIFRLGDMRKRSRILEAKLKAQIITQKLSKRGEIYNYLKKLPLTIDDCENDLLFLWPMTVVHKITPSSPFYDISKKDLKRQNFEIVVSLEGTTESTDQKTQVRSSYLANEILWGRRFQSVMSLDEKKQGYTVDYSKFDETIEDDDTPVYSAAEINQMNLI